MRVFIQGVDDYIGSSIKRLLLADQAKKMDENNGELEEGEEELVIIGSVASSLDFKPKGVKDTVSRDNLDQVCDLARSADAIVLDTYASVKEASNIVKSLKRPFEGTKSLVLISTLLTWDMTPAPKMTDDDLGDENQADEDHSETIKVPTFNEDDFTRRKPSPSFLLHKTLESQVLALSHDSLATTVLATGLVYGAEEGLLQNFFRDAWLGRDAYLPALHDNCSNIIPTIHVDDLARAASSCLKEAPSQQYVVVADESRSSVYDIVSAVYSVLQLHPELALEETPIVEGQDDEGEDSEKQNAWKQFRITPKLVNVLEADEMFAKDPAWVYLQANLAFNTSESTIQSLVEEWKSREGLVQNITSVINEFKASRNLRPIRLVVHGPPCGGKSTLSEKVAREYYLPVITASKALEFLTASLEATRKEREEKLLNLRQSRLAQKEQKREEAKEQDQEDGESEEDNILDENDDPEFQKLKRKSVLEQLAERVELCLQTKGHLSNKLAEKVLRARLLQPDCVNHGFILDGEVSTYQSCKRIFGIAPVSSGLGTFASEDGEGPDNTDFENYPDDEEASEEKETDADDIEEAYVPDPRLAPTAVVVVEASDEILLERACSSTGPDAKTEDEFSMSLELYRKRNADHLIQTPLSFFEGLCHLESLLLPTDGCQLVFDDDLKSHESKLNEEKQNDSIQDETLSNVMLYIEQGGRPFNYHPTEDEILAIQLDKKAAQLVEEEARRRQKLEIGEKRKAEEADRIKAMKEHSEQVARHEADILEARSEPLQAYLLKHIMPTLSKGLVETCRVKPDDPIDFLAEYLFRNSSENEADVPN